MTPCSAAAGGSFSSRASSRSAALRTSSGSSAASICSRSSSTSACCSSPSPSSSWIAFSCWRRKYSRWPLSISDWTCDWICEPSCDDLELAGEDLREPAQPLGDVDLLEQLLLLLGRDAQRAGDQVARARDGSSMLATAICSSSGRYGICSMISRERAAARCGSAPRARAPRSTTSGSSAIARDEVGLLGDAVARAARAGRPGRGCAASRRGP